MDSGGEREKVSLRCVYLGGRKDRIGVRGEKGGGESEAPVPALF